MDGLKVKFNCQAYRFSTSAIIILTEKDSAGFAPFTFGSTLILAVEDAWRPPTITDMKATMKIQIEKTTLGFFLIALTTPARWIYN